MPEVIAISCGQCGRDLKVVAKFAGKRIKCPTCGQPISVPGGPPALPSRRKPETVQSRPSKSIGDWDKKQTSPSAASGTPAPTTPPAPRKRKRPVPQKEMLDEVEFLDDAEDAYEDYGDTDFDDDFGDDDFGDDRPRTSNRRTGRQSRDGRSSSRRGRNKKGRQKQDTGFGGTNAGVLGGILMIVVAVVWFVGGLAAGIIFKYPPILLIIGIVAIIRGVMS
ncbi:MAG: hypothetical protein ABGZ17_04270 [Planctomycetaceae bacterium]